MKLLNLSTEDALGCILVHNVADEKGHKALPKGKKLDAGDIEKALGLGKNSLYVGVLEAEDVREDDAVARIARSVAGPNIILSKPVGGRVNLTAQTGGIFKSNNVLLKQINSIEGVTIATILGNAVVASRKMVATIKTIGLALPEKSISEVETLGKSQPVIFVEPFKRRRVAIVLTGDQASKERVEGTFLPALRSRVEEFGGIVVSTNYVPEDEKEIAGVISIATQESDCVVIAGETSIMDQDDITPRGIKQAGGRVELYGAPVEPGNLLLLAYRGSIPIVGAPGCVKSRDINVVDLVLPRLMAGERVTKADIIELANGGLLI